MVPGATAYGLMNDSSKTKAGSVFKDAISAHPEYLQIFCLGEVDCNALVWRREVTIPSFVILATNKYFKFVNSFSTNPAVCSVPLPPVESYQTPPYSLRKDKSRGFVKADKQLRTEVVNFFNLRMKCLCETVNCPFLDLTPHIKNGNGTLNMKFSKNLADSHLKVELVEPIIERLLHETEGLGNYLEP